jgi:hypothetical protein
MQSSPVTDQPPPMPLPLPDDAATRDAKYAELAALMDAWIRDEHTREPEWDLVDLSPVRLRVPAGRP